MFMYADLERTSLQYLLKQMKKTTLLNLKCSKFYFEVFFLLSIEIKSKFLNRYNNVFTIESPKQKEPSTRNEKF